MHDRILITGAGGFIGSHLARRLRESGAWLRGVDVKYPDFSETATNDFILSDLRNTIDPTIFQRIDAVVALAADIGGMGHISKNEASILRNNSLIDLGTFQMAADAGIKRLLYASSACVYPRQLQDSPATTALKEEDAFPADPDGAYGFEKLFGEQLARYYSAQYGQAISIARFHNIYGPEGTFEGGREKVPAALCRKVALASDGDYIEVWGDGQQSRSFCFISDCVDAIEKMLYGEASDPLNVGSDAALSINELAEMVIQISGKDLRIKNCTGPQGVRGRNSDGTAIRHALGWSPTVDLSEGLATTYQWVERQLSQRANTLWGE